MSTLIGLDTDFPGGNDGQNWLSATYAVPSGNAISLTDIIGPHGLPVVAASVRAGLAVWSDGCADAALTSDPGTAGPFAPTTANYSHWVLLPAGLRVAFDQGRIGGEACGWASTVVPWSALRGVLTPAGRAAVATLHGSVTYTPR